MRDEYLKGVLASEKSNLGSSGIAARDEFNRQHRPTKGLIAERTMRLHNIERHALQLSPE
jgi:hypothetical protein